MSPQKRSSSLSKYSTQLKSVSQPIGWLVGRLVAWMAGLIDVALSGLSRRRSVKLMESRGGGVCQNESHE